MLEDVITDNDRNTSFIGINYEERDSNTNAFSTEKGVVIYTIEGTFKDDDCFFNSKGSVATFQSSILNSSDFNGNINIVDDVCELKSNSNNGIYTSRNRRKQPLFRSHSIDNYIISQLRPSPVFFDVNTIKDELDALKFIKNLESFQIENSIEDTLDFIYSFIDELLLNQKYDSCNVILEKLQISKLKEQSMIGILTITFSFKKFLPYRNILFKEIENYFRIFYANEEAKIILLGLE